ncbi:MULTISPECIES: hypothetical protein [unclassified Paenibacillus]|uniref:hypothetical protein n=1 Tax=unclassified Paenibacillus TaxID=185978 RepID=UPI0021097224|nr:MULTISPECIES: hypothetical protein [unclassified Paenibacillus]
MRDFFGVLHDLGNNTKGIFVTKVGYQSGAKKFGDYYGISLKEMRPPNHEDWNGRIRNIEGVFSMIKADNIRCEIEFDDKWILKHYKREDFNADILQKKRDLRQLVIEDARGNIIKTFSKYVQRFTYIWSGRT